jgi:LacI family transcriptional regulator
VDYVGVNDEELGAAAARYLVMGGHRRIALLSGTSSLPAHVYLVKGLKRGLAEAGIDLDESLIGCTGYDTGKGFLTLDGWFARRKHRPTAIIAADDSLLANLYDYLDARSLKTPDDVAVIARTSSASGPIFRPHPTAFHVPTFEMGKLAAEMLIDSIENPTHERHRVFLPFTFSRGATG